VNFRLHHGAQRLENHAVALQRRFTLKRFGYDPDIEVTTAGAGTFVPGMQMTLVLNEEFIGSEFFGELRFDGSNSPGCHGSTGMKGLTVTFA
jgi:hypothetical protein